MSNAREGKNSAEAGGAERAPYEAPAIVYEGLITTRAVTQGAPGNDIGPAANPADVFSSDD